MTKKQMIQEIQLAEAAAFLELKEAENYFGNDSNICKRCRTRWAGIHDMMKVLGIENDFTLPDNVKAFSIITERIAKAQA